MITLFSAIRRHSNVASNRLQPSQTASCFDRLLAKLEPVKTVSSAEQRLLRTVQALCNDADRSRSMAETTTDSKTRKRILQDRLRVTGKALGDSLVEAVKMKSLGVAKKIFVSYQQRYSAKAFHYNALLSISSMQSAFDILKEMQTKNIAPDRKTFLFLFQNCNSEGQFNVVFSLLCKSRTLRVQLDAITYTAIISAAERCQGIDLADSIFKDIDRWNVKPDAVTYSMMIHMHAKRRNHHRCVEMYDAMKSMHLEPDETVEALIRQVRKKINSKCDRNRVDTDKDH